MKLVTDLSLTGRPPRPARGPRDPSLVLDFVAGRFTPGGFGQTIQFARATTASFHDASGVMQTAAIDQPRIDHDRGTGLVRGLLVENARTNLLLNAATPVTQTVSVTAALHALSFRGTGTITLSGAHSASLTGPGGNARAVLVFTPAAGAPERLRAARGFSPLSWQECRQGPPSSTGQSERTLALQHGSTAYDQL